VSRDFIEKNFSDVLNKLGTTSEELLGMSDPFNQLSKSEAIVKALDSSLEGLINTQKTIGNTTIDFTNNINASIPVTESSTDALEEQNEVLEDQRDYLKEMLEYWEKYRREAELLDIDEDAIFEADLANEPPAPPLPDTEETKEQGEELLAVVMSIQEAITDAYIDSVDRRIDKLQEEQNAAEAQQKYLQELAKSGQIDAQQSLLATQRQAEELEREQRKLEKRKAQIQLISTGLSTYANAIEQGQSPAEALTSTIANTQLLVSGLKSIQAFKDGSEDVGKGGRMDKDGGFLAMLHPRERVMTAEQNAKVSGLSNPLLAEIGHKFKTGELIERGGQVGYDMNAIVAELQDLKSTIKNKPEHYVNFESIAGKMYLNHTKRAGKTTIHNKYKVN